MLGAKGKVFNLCRRQPHCQCHFLAEILIEGLVVVSDDAWLKDIRLEGAPAGRDV